MKVGQSINKSVVHHWCFLIDLDVASALGVLASLQHGQFGSLILHQLYTMPSIRIHAGIPMRGMFHPGRSGTSPADYIVHLLRGELGLVFVSVWPAFSALPPAPQSLESSDPAH